MIPAVPRFSVVIPAYNAERTIEQTISSVLEQTATDLELIVVDDESTDSTARVVRGLAAGDPRLRLVEQSNTGTAGARNAGISQAAAPYVSFLDNDDLWMPSYLERMGAALDRHPRAAFAYCDAYGLDDESLRLRRRTELESRPPPPADAAWAVILLALARANFVMSSATVRRRVLEQVGGFRGDVFGVDDYDLWFRILLEGHGAVLAAPEPLLLQRDRADSQSKDDPVMLEGLRRVLARVLADERLPAAARDEVERQLGTVTREQSALAGEARATRLLLAARRAAVRARDRLLDHRLFRDRPPEEVAAAFPELARGGDSEPRRR